MSKTWNQLAADWLEAHPGWHETNEIAEAIDYPSPHHMSGILHLARGVEEKWRGPLIQMLWRFKDDR